MERRTKIYTKFLATIFLFKKINFTLCADDNTLYSFRALEGAFKELFSISLLLVSLPFMLPWDLGRAFTNHW